MTPQKGEISPVCIAKTEGGLFHNPWLALSTAVMGSASIYEAVIVATEATTTGELFWCK